METYMNDDRYAAFSIEFDSKTHRLDLRIMVKIMKIAYCRA